MAGPEYTTERFGGVTVHVLTFAKDGDILGMHAHGDLDVHFTIVARGSVLVRGPGWEQVATAGTILDFRVGQLHEFEALEDDTRIFNIEKRVTAG